MGILNRYCTNFANAPRMIFSGLRFMLILEAWLEDEEVFKAQDKAAPGRKRPPWNRLDKLR
jgi:hypothetical protein